MHPYRPDRVVRGLTGLVSFAYYAVWAGAIVALVAAPAAKLFVGDDPHWTWGLKVPATLLDSEATVRASWGVARLVVEDVRGVLVLPVAALPWSLVALLWAYTAAVFGLLLLFLHHLRRLFQRVRDGAPFDAGNALRMRALGLLLLAFALFNGVAELVTGRVVREGLASEEMAISGALHIDLPLVFIGLVLVSLAEIFRRGAELESEQSLVI